MWEPAVLARVSKHYETGKPLPDSLIKRMLALKHFRDGFNGTSQAFYAAFSDTPTGMQPAMRSPRRRSWHFWRARVR